MVKYKYDAWEMCKALNADGFEITTSLLIAFAVGAILGGIFGGISAAAQGQNVFAGIVIGALTGGFTGMMAEFSWPIALYWCI